MSSGSSLPPAEPSKSKPGLSLWLGLGVLCILVVVLIVGKFGGLFDPVELGEALGQNLRGFADTPFGLPALIVAFCLCAFIAVPQFVLIGVAMYAFGPGLGAVFSWIATLVSGSLTYGIGRWSGRSVLERVSSKGLDTFAKFIGRNAFAASAVVRNAPAGPFVFVNMAFGALNARFLSFLAGMALGIVPKIAVVGFAGKGVRAAVEGNPVLAVVMAVAALGLIAGGMVYVRQRRKSGKMITLSPENPVDTGA